MDTTQTSRRQILVVGSSNTDMVIKAAHLPRPGETILGGTFFMNPGGKGANQAVAIARLGGSVTFICKTGSDIFGHQSQQLFEEEGINTSYVFSDSGNPSGVALITVDEKAENCIVVASGANANLLPSDLAKAEEAIELADLILMQLEVPMETVCFVADIAWQKGKKVILNPAPAHPLPADLLHHLYLITPNETEAEMITGVKITDDISAVEAARIDGANSWQMLWKVTIPNMMSSFTICIFLTLTNGFKLFDQNLALTGGRPFLQQPDGSVIKTTEMLALNIYSAFYSGGGNNRGVGQAKAVVFFILVAVIGLIQLQSTRKKEVQQ